ncbi:MAG: hypothetical protein ACYC61_20895 [Isosphaeraceae bacterium]
MDDPNANPNADVNATAATWCDEARALCGGPAGEASDRGERVVIERIDAVARGMKIRRQLDGLDLDEATEAARRAVVERLADLESRMLDDLAGLSLGTSVHRQIAARARQTMADARIAAQNVLTVLEFEPLHQAMAVESLRADLEWLVAVIARLDGEIPAARGVWLDAELERLRGLLGRPDGRRAEQREDPLTSQCEAMQASLLGRRVRRELARPLSDAGPEALWAHRFLLSRIQAHVAALDRTPDGGRAEDEDRDGELIVRATGPTDWLERLEIRRTELAELADERMTALPVVDRAGPCTRAVASAFDEIGETTALLEQMPPHRAVRRLELARDDLDRLRQSCRAWASEEPGADRPTEAAPPSSAADEPDETAADDARSSDAAASAMRYQANRLGRLSRRVKSEWREKLLVIRMNALLGQRGARLLENAVLVLIPVLIGLIAAEWLLERAGPLSAAQHRFFAWTDLAICSVFLVEVAVRMSLAPERGAYLVRHLLIDLLPSLPFGFLAHQIDLAEMAMPAAEAAGTGALEWLADMGRMTQVLRTSRLILPLARLARITLILLRLSDRMVRRMARVLNRNIVLFEPSSAQRPESRDRHRLLALRSELEQARAAVEERLALDDRRALAARLLADHQARIDRLPALAIETNPESDPDAEEREIPVEAVVERLIQMTPERLIDRMGPGFVHAADRYLRLLDLPLIRRLPGVRNLVVYREKGPAEAVALAANYLGDLIQRSLDVVYFLADLHGTLSPPVFLDRLGATIVNATRTPARRLLYLGSAFLLLFLVVQTVPILSPFRTVMDRVSKLLGLPMILLGVVCLGLWSLGAWFRRIANQSADFCERIVEAQFAAHTKNLKSRRREQDVRFLSERVIDPELLLRSSDDRVKFARRPAARRTEAGDRDRDGDSERVGAAPTASPNGDARQDVPFPFEDRELAFLRNVRLLYQDYLDGSPLHRSDTKASIQLLGNLALANLRRSHLRHFLREGRLLDRLDLNRAGGLFGGPYLWFNYITRLLVQETALLILDYNRHAIPVDRLACSPAPIREQFRAWISARLEIAPEAVWLPEPPAASPSGERLRVVGEGESRGEEHDIGDRSRFLTRKSYNLTPVRRQEFLETVEFTAVDFLADDADRDAEIGARFGPQVAELVRRDRQQNVRRAFRSFPLHELPLSSRTINPFALYEAYIAGGRVMLLPVYTMVAIARAIGLAIRSVYRVVGEILHPRVDQDNSVPADTYWAALRKIHRMRKPVFMGSLWLRARFDVEYLGLPLPTAPANIAAESVMEADLDYIGATRQDRIIAEQVRREHQARLEWTARWLRRFGWSFDELPGYLAVELPYLVNRGGEALRALVAACVLDHDDIATLALSIEGLARVMEHAADPSQNPAVLPPGLPEPVVNLRALWHPVHRIRRPIAGLFELPCFSAYDARQRRRILEYFRRHRRTVRGWIRVVLGQGDPDPWDTVRSRMRDVLLRTDLWSDQILVLRAVQTLTMLDVQHNCELVWNLGGYTRSAEPREPDPDPDSGEPPRPENQDVPTIPLAS